MRDKVFDWINLTLMLIVLFITVYPLIYVVSISVSSPLYVKANMVTFLPKGFHLNSYKQVFENPFFGRAYSNTIFYTTVGTAINLLVTCPMAFALSRKELLFQKQLMVFAVVTMFVSGGLIPIFLVVKSLGMYNSFWALIIPGAVSTYNMIIVRTYMAGLPEEVVESARIDGASDLCIFCKLIIPLSLPVIATIGLYYAVGHWNNYFGPMIYLMDREKYPLQLLLKEMMINEDMQGMEQGARDAFQKGAGGDPTSNMLICASMIIAMIPILCVYPFIQKYFVKGIMIGALKG